MTAEAPADSAAPLLEVRGLTTEFRGDENVVRAVDDVSFHVGKGEVVGIVGESGSGKSATSLSLMRLLPPRGRVVAGSVKLAGEELLTLPESRMRRVRGGRIAMIFQDPMTSLNPYLRVGEQLAEVGRIHGALSPDQAHRKGVELLDRVGIPDAASRARSYPHELSGGMRQRVMIAMALLGGPELLLADEPTTALDVTIQAQILELIAELRREHGLSVVLVTHDLGVVSAVADRILVMYAGRIVESAPSRSLFAEPLHPYTRALARSVPRLDARGGKRLDTIAGMPPRLDAPFRECRFAPRCEFVHAACREGDPPLVPSGVLRERRCVLPVERLR